MTEALYISGALAFSAAAVLAFGTAMELEGRLRYLMVPALYALILINVCAGPLLQGRDIFAVGTLAAPTAAAKWFTRLIIVTVLTICLARMVAAAFSRENRGAGGGALLAALLLYFITNTVLASTFGTYPQFNHDEYYVPFLFAAVYASRTQDPEISIGYAKVALFSLLAASCLVALVAPDVAIESNYPGWLPGVTIRFWGLETHANSMAPLALVYLFLAIHQPFERRWLQWLGMALGIGVLLLAQSKTTWSAAAIAIPALLVLRRRAWRATAFSLVGLGALVGLALLFAPALEDPLAALAQSEQAQDATGLTGRDIIWSVAIQEWMRNPLFGYGVTMWNDAYRMQIGLDHAVSAHNQFLQALSVAGAMGLIGLVVYLGALAACALRAARASRGLSVALLVLIALRCLTETPLGIGTFLSGAFMTQLLLFHITLVYGYRAARAAPPATSSLSAQRRS
jgi:O-antigen ligase